MIAAIAAAHASGLPPVVDVWMNGSLFITLQILGVDMKAPMGITPPPRALADPSSLKEGIGKVAARARHTNTKRE